MKNDSPDYFHSLIGVKKTRIVYQKKDFIDYTLMTLITALIVGFVFGPIHFLSILVYVLSIFMIVSFSIRHGVEFKVPVIVKRPQDILYMFIYRARNLTLMYIFALSLLLLENYLIYLTPNLPHHVNWMHNIAITLFYVHFISLTLYRSRILFAHLNKRLHIKEVLMQTSWKGHLSRQKNITIEILQAYSTGMLSHILLIAPWYVIINIFNFSIIFLPIICAVNFFIQHRFLKVLNAWFYRDHWICHNSELDFLYLHGMHHDAIPSGLIGVSGNGPLEGFIRHSMGAPAPFYNPIVTFIVYNFEVKGDIDGHQYIPGVYPYISQEFQEITQHSMHHFGRLEPYSFGMKSNQPHVSEEMKHELRFLPDTITNGIELDERLTGYQWDNPKYKSYLNLYKKYSK